KPISTPYIYEGGARGRDPCEPRHLLAAAPPSLSAAAHAVRAVLAHRRPAFHPRTCGLRGGAAATAALIGCWDQVRGARFVGRDRLLPLHRRATSSAALRV